MTVQTGQFIHAICSRFEAQTFAAVLKRLVRHRRRGKRTVVILDHARSHHARLLAPLLHQYRRFLTLVCLPPSSPQLAPIERVWKLVRRLATHNRDFATLAELLAPVDACCNRWRRPNPVLRRLGCMI